MAPPPEEPREASPGDATATREPESEPAKELTRQVEELTRQVAALTDTARREHERAAHREQVIDRLHGENQQLRHGLLQEALTPVRAGLYRLYDTVAREAARWRAADPPDAALAGDLLAAVADEVAEVLGRTGAERCGVRPGDAYDPAAHRPARTTPVEAGADGTVVEVLAEGFAMGERVLRKASVVVGRVAAGNTAGNASGNASGDDVKPAAAKAEKDAKKADITDVSRQQRDRKDVKDRLPRDGTGDTAPERVDGGTDKESE
ncbi:nucleotide exchange factor GrpE [Sphaerisporangium corydalis]|uniref:Nucleotide exchange factor GrpE n=1 Tax=Sphaerisporangium corydalis TaxID=1441875 RepID=A0ABV9ESV1_9ACTN|nr:nucleotide exchange factor GrpE [Sphaerisporangium corydalis]